MSTRAFGELDYQNPIGFADGSLGTPTQTWNSAKTAGWYFDTVPKYSFNGSEIITELGNNNVDNTEIPTPTNVAYYRRDYAPPYDESTENAAIYCRIDHRGSPDTDFRYWVYGEITDQSIVGGSFTKVMHRGAGDAHYVAILGDNTSAYGYEAAMFGGWQNPPTNTVPKQENGFIATFQGAGSLQESVKDQSNSTCFQALVHDNGVDPTSPTPWATNYGLFYANNALSNAFVARRSEFAQNYSMFKLMDHTSNQRPIWQVFADGQQWHNADEATVGSPNQSPAPLILRGYYWGGSAEQANQTQLSHQVTGAGGGIFRVDIGDPGSEVLALQVGETGNTAITGWMKVGAGSLIQCGTDGQFVLTDSVGTDFDLLKLGGNTNAFPALGRSGAQLEARAADDSAYARFNALSLYVGNSAGGALLDATASGTVPSVIPNQGDTDTGVGSAGADELSLIAGGVELMNLQQNDASIDEITTAARWVMNTVSSSIPLLIRGSGNGARVQIENSATTLYGYFGSMQNLWVGAPTTRCLGMRSETEIVLATGGGNTRFTIDSVGRVAIGGATPNTSSQLDLQRTDGALTIPRLTTTQRGSLTPINGMVIYNTTDNKFQGYENGSWTNLI